MPTGLVALLDDVAAIAKVAAASVDDIGVAATRAGTKSAGVVIDDAAVTPQYMTGFSPARERPSTKSPYWKKVRVARRKWSRARSAPI